MAERNDSTPQRAPDEEMVGRLQSELGLSSESIEQMSEDRLAWVLNKLEIPDRPRARLQHEREALIGDDGEIRTEGQAEALAQLAPNEGSTPQPVP